MLSAGDGRAARQRVAFAQDTRLPAHSSSALPHGLTPQGVGVFHNGVRAGHMVKLAPDARADGVLGAGEVGVVIRYDGLEHVAPFKVRSPRGPEGWYMEKDLLPVTDVEAGLMRRVEQYSQGLASPHTLLYHFSVHPGERVGISCKTHNGCVVVASLAPGSPAQRSGLTPGCIVSRLNGMAVSRLEDMQEAMDYLRVNQTRAVPIEIEVDRLVSSHEYGDGPTDDELVLERLEVLHAMRELESPRRFDRFGGLAGNRETTMFFPRQTYYIRPDLEGTYRVLADAPASRSDLSLEGAVGVAAGDGGGLPSLQDDDVEENAKDEQRADGKGDGIAKDAG
eukprot:TRINITY_DN16774_c0_g2_i1.p1 TRINITY_DN16774_c0_g2~~TRINITY_DN16774_c0_g2_i1.p1  ORF type:complete len:337 (+),score=46.46 TRINITY_DN16774_c0_g2_i1:52-1062(+)